jgi:hypothetical protein
MQVTEEMYKIPTASESDIYGEEVCRRGLDELDTSLIEPIPHRLCRSIGYRHGIELSMDANFDCVHSVGRVGRMHSSWVSEVIHAWKLSIRTYGTRLTKEDRLTLMWSSFCMVKGFRSASRIHHAFHHNW